jgi:hypothetical protein
LRFTFAQVAFEQDETARTLVKVSRNQARGGLELRRKHDQHDPADGGDRNSDDSAAKERQKQTDAK